MNKLFKIKERSTNNNYNNNSKITTLNNENMLYLPSMNIFLTYLIHINNIFI